jgi:hypothetical protein
MAGTPIGKIDQDMAVAAPNCNQELFKNCFDFFEQMVTAGYATRIALQYGASGTGTDYHDGANPFGENAFFVYRMDGATSGNTASDRDGVTLPDFDYYVLVQWADAAAFGTTPGNPGKLNDAVADGVGIAVAVREDGTSPWGGTTNNDGTDTKGATVWTDGGSTVHVFPTSNEILRGVTVTNKENLRLLIDFTSTGGRVHMVGDADSFAILLDGSDDTSYAVTYFGVYYPLPGLTPSMPLVCLSSTANSVWSEAVAWGSNTGNGTYEGGVLGAHLADGMVWPTTGWTAFGILEDALQPSTESGSSVHDALPIRVVVSSVATSTYGSPRNRSGYVGNVNTNVMLMVDNVASESTNVALTRAYFGSSTAANTKHSVPWDGVTVPGSTLTRAGVTF